MTQTFPRTIRQLAGIPPTVPSLSEAVLIMIDQQNEYVDGPLRLNGIDAAIDANVRLLSAARAAEATIIHIAQTGSPGGPFDRAGHRGGFIAAVEPLPGELVIEKRLASAFFETTLPDILAGVDSKSLILAGYMTHNCVAATAFDAVTRGFSVTILSDACASRDLPNGHGGVIAGADIHRGVLAGLSDRQAVIATVAELLAVLEV
jgi:nicotinamidase-related amidase